MQINFSLSQPFQRAEYLQVLKDIEKEFSDRFPGVRKIVIEIKLHTQAAYKPAFIISGIVSEQFYKVRLNFTRFYKENKLPDIGEFCDRIKTAVNRVTKLSDPS
ncbi:MAG: hypothetical protein ABUT20_32330, partial [Bacteroidota bacterium]